MKSTIWGEYGGPGGSAGRFDLIAFSGGLPNVASQFVPKRLGTPCRGILDARAPDKSKAGNTSPCGVLVIKISSEK